MPSVACDGTLRYRTFQLNKYGKVYSMSKIKRRIISVIIAVFVACIAIIIAVAAQFFDIRSAFGIGRISSPDEVDESSRIHSVIHSDTAIELEWYRNHLDSEEKVALYDAMEAAISSVSMGVTVPNMTEEDVLECYWAVIYDHPEFFWLSREYHYQTLDDLYVAFDFVYFMTDKDEIQSKMRDIELISDAVISGGYVDDKHVSMSYIYKWVGGTTNYKEGEHDQTMLGVFDDHEAICAGYVQAVQYIWLRAGIPCVRIGGHSVESNGAQSDDNHTWLAAVPSNRLYFYDVTWDDMNNAYNMGEYFEISQAEFDETHIAESDGVPCEDGDRDDAQEVVETAIKVSTGEHLVMPERLNDWNEY